MSLVVIVTLAVVCLFVNVVVVVVIAVVAVVVIIAVMAIVVIVTLVAVLMLVGCDCVDGLMYIASYGLYCVDCLLQILCDCIVRIVSSE